MKSHQNFTMARVLASTLLTLSFSSAIWATESHETAIVMVPTPDAQQQVYQELMMSGTTLLKERHVYSYFEMPRDRAETIAENPRVRLHPEPEVRLRRYADRDASFNEDRRLKIVQYRVPISAEERNELSNLGVRVVSFVPDDALLILLPENDQEIQSAFSQHVTSSAIVHEVLDYQPVFTYDKSLESRFASEDLITCSLTIVADENYVSDFFEYLAFNPSIRELRELAPITNHNQLTTTLITPGNLIEPLSQLEGIVFIQETGSLKLAGEESSLIVMNHTKDDSGNEIPIPPSDSTNGLNYVDWLYDTLYDVMGSKVENPDNFPVVIVNDTGIDEGGSLSDFTVPFVRSPDLRDSFDTSSIKESRVIRSFAWDWRKSCSLEEDPPEFGFPCSVLPGEIVTDKDGVFVAHRPEDDAPNCDGDWWDQIEPSYIDTDPDFYDPTLTNTCDLTSAPYNYHTEIHGHIVASILGGYENTKNDEFFEHPAKKFQYGMGTNPFGRMVNAKIFNGPVVPYDEELTSVFQFDNVSLFWFLARGYEITQQANSSTSHRSKIFTNSWIIELEDLPECGDSKYDHDNPFKISYDFYTATIDFNTRDSLDDFWGINDYYHESTTWGANQEALYVFAAGNEGLKFLNIECDGCTPDTSAYNEQIPQMNTVRNPSLAKNALTVGASEVPAFWEGDPICGFEVFNHPEFMTSADDIAPFSAKGKEGDFRVKPDIVAPGAGVIGNTFLEFLRDGCPGVNHDLIPVNRTNMEWPHFFSRVYGTSYATPQVSGVAQISGAWLKEEYGFSKPSPALLKAYVIHTGKLLRGRHTGPYDPVHDVYETVKFPSPYQGFGRVNLSMALDDTPRMIIDQSVLMESPFSSTFDIYGKIADPDKPFRAVLVWTDPAASGSVTTYQELVNDLDLYVSIKVDEIGGSPVYDIYEGNNFCDTELEFSKKIATRSLFQIDAPPATDSPDRRNNVEAVYLDELGDTPDVWISIYAHRIIEEAVDIYGYGFNPPLPSGTKTQDFALVLYNFIED